MADNERACPAAELQPHCNLFLQTTFTRLTVPNRAEAEEAEDEHRPLQLSMSVPLRMIEDTALEPRSIFLQSFYCAVRQLTVL